MRPSEVMLYFLAIPVVMHGALYVRSLRVTRKMSAMAATNGEAKRGRFEGRVRGRGQGSDIELDASGDFCTT